jgi:hypothetical protein
MTPLYISSNRIIIVAAISAVSLFVGSLFLYQVHAQPLVAVGEVMGISPPQAPQALQAAGGGPSAFAATTGLMQAAPTLEMHVANNGLVLLRGARVVAVEGNTIRVTMDFSAAPFNWAVQTDSNTKFVTLAGGNGSLGDIRAGAIVTVTGTLASGAGSSVYAQYVRE